MKLSDISRMLFAKTPAESVKIKPNQSLNSFVNRHSDFRVSKEFSAYDSAVYTAKNYDNPNRYTLLKYYDRQLEIDGHLASLYERRIDSVLSQKLTIKKGKKSLDVPQELKYFIRYAMEAIFYGNTLLQLRSGKVELIDRNAVIPEDKMIKASPFDYKGYYDYSERPDIIDINYKNSPRELGLLLKLARLSIIKEQGSLNWGEFIETYGQPITVVTTDSNDPREINEIDSMLRNMARKKFMIKNSLTDVNYQSAQSGGVTDLYESFIKHLNDEMSKLVLGGTMLTDSGSSRSQAEVHERGSLLIIKKDMDYILTLIIDNKQKLQQYDILPSGNIQVSFDDIEVLTVAEKIQLDQFILDNYSKAPEFFKNRYGITINELEKINIRSDRTRTEEVDSEVSED